MRLNATSPRFTIFIRRRSEYGYFCCRRSNAGPFCHDVYRYFLARRDWINDSLSSALSRLVVNIFNPFLMISSVFGQSLKQSGPLFWENLVLVGIFYLLLFLAGFFIVFCPPANESNGPNLQTAVIASELQVLMGIPIVSSPAWRTVHYLRRRLHARV